MENNKIGHIFNIQKFSVNDGPGIRTVVFFKGCPLHCEWCANPESQMTKPQVFWDNKKCLRCGHCVSICHNEAMKLEYDKVIINHNTCNGCRKCMDECSAEALLLEGYTSDVNKIMEVIDQDEVFYLESGGGVTLSGGEVMMQSDFAIQILKACKKKGYSTAVETTAFCQKEVFLKVIEYVDYLMIDFKHYSSDKHLEKTGVNNEIIIENIKASKSLNKQILIRIPVIPGFNDSLDDALSFSLKLKELDIHTCQLLPFHQFGENKYHLLNKPYVYEDVPSLHKEDLIEYQNIFKSNGIDAYF